MIVKDSLTELRETNIWKYLNEIDSQYASRAISFVEHLTPVLKSIQEIFPFYTRHDAHHSYRVLKRMGEVIQPDCIIGDTLLSFTNIEAFLLICSAYAHDLGMAVFPNEEKQLLPYLDISIDSDWKTNLSLQNYVRNNHSVRGIDFIDHNLKTLKFPRHLVNHLDILMKAHNMSINELDSISNVRLAAGDKEIDIKQLACILCVADSLEFSETRIVDGVINLLADRIKNKEDKEALKSYQENMKHVCIGDNLAIGRDNRIVITGSFNDPEVLNLAHKTIDFIEGWVRKYTDIDYRSPLKRFLVIGDAIERNLSILGSDFERLGIRIKKDHIINLISSHTTWNDNSAAIKELLQNSVEACRFRSFHSSAADNYLPKITLTINKAERKIVLTDNGCGMTRNTILDNFLTVGNSRSMEPTYSSRNFKSLARFGIGFWSVFTIAEVTDIVSAPFEYLKKDGNSSDRVDGLQFSVSVSEFKDYTIFKKIKSIPGTTITLYIKDKIELDDLVTKLNSQLLCTVIPIEILNDGEMYHVPSNIMLPSLRAITHTKYTMAIEEAIKVYVFEKQVGDFELKMLLLYCIDNNGPSFLLKGGKTSVLQVIQNIHGPFKLAICGFAVNISLSDLIFDLGRVGTMISSIKDPDGFVYNMQRFDLLPSKKREEIIDLIIDVIHEGYKQFFINHNAFNKQSVYELNLQTRMHGGNSSTKYTSKRLFNLYSKYSDLLSFKLFNLDAEKELSTAKIIYMDLDELRNHKYELWCCNTTVRGISVTIFPEEELAILFKIISEFNKEKVDVFFIPPSCESDMLFDNDPNSFIEIKHVQYNQSHFKIPFTRIFTNSVIPVEEHPWFICSVTGVWTGNILEKKIIGANFVILGMDKLIVNPDSLICKKIHELYDNGQIIKLCSLVSFLKAAQEGAVDKSVEEYL